MILKSKFWDYSQWKLFLCKIYLQPMTCRFAVEEETTVSAAVVCNRRRNDICYSCRLQSKKKPHLLQLSFAIEKETTFPTVVDGVSMKNEAWCEHCRLTHIHKPELSAKAERCRVVATTQSKLPQLPGDCGKHSSQRISLAEILVWKIRTERRYKPRQM